MSSLRRCCSGPQEEMEMEQQQQLDEASNLLPVATPPLAASGDRAAMTIECQDGSVQNDHDDVLDSARFSSSQRQRPQTRRGLRANRRPFSRAHSTSSADIDVALQSMVEVAATSPGDCNSTNHRGRSGERKISSARSRLGAFLRRTTTPRRSNITTKSGPTDQASGTNYRNAKTNASSSTPNNSCPATHTANNPGPVLGRRLTRPRESSAVSSSEYKPAAAVAASGAPASDRGTGGADRGASGTASASSSRRSVIRPFYRSKSAVVDRAPAPDDTHDQEDDQGRKSMDSVSSSRRSVIRTFYRSKSAVVDRAPAPDDTRDQEDDQGGKPMDSVNSSRRSVIRTFSRSKSAVVDRAPAPDDTRDGKDDQGGKASGRRRHLSASHAAAFLFDSGRPGRREGGDYASNVAGRAFSSAPVRSSRPPDARRAEEMPILDRASSATGSQARVSRGTCGQNGGRDGKAHVVVAVSTKAAARDGGDDSGIEYDSGIRRVAGVPGQNGSEGLGPRLLPPAAAVAAGEATLRSYLKPTTASTVSLAPGSTHDRIVDSAAIGEHVGHENGIGESRSDRDAPEAWRVKAERGGGKMNWAEDGFGNVSGPNDSQVRGKGSRSSKDLVLVAGGDRRVVSRAVDAPLAIDDDGRRPRRVASAAEGRAIESSIAPAGGNATSTAFRVSPIANSPAEPSSATVAESAASDGLLPRASRRKRLAELLHFRRRGSPHGINDGSEGRASVLRSSVLAAAVADTGGDGKMATALAINEGSISRGNSSRSTVAPQGDSKTTGLRGKGVGNAGQASNDAGGAWVETVAARAAMKARVWADTVPVVGGRRRSGRSVSPEKHYTDHDHDDGPSAGHALDGNSSRMGAQGSLTRMRNGQHGDVPLKGGVVKGSERGDEKPGSGVRNRLARGSFGGRSYRSVVPVEMSWDDQREEEREEEPYQSTEAPSPRGEVEKGVPLKASVQEADRQPALFKTSLQEADPAPAPLKTSLQEAEPVQHNGSSSPWHSWAGGEASEFSVRTKGRGSTEVMSPSAPSLYELVGVDAFRSTSGMVRSVHPLFAPVFDSACRPLSGGEGVTVHPALVVSEKKVPSGAERGPADVEACVENRSASTASTSASTSAWTSVVGGGEDTAAISGVASADTGHPDIPSVLVVNCPVVSNALEGVPAVHFVYVFRATRQLRRYAARLSVEERSLSEDKMAAEDYGSGVTSLEAAGVFVDRVMHSRDSGVEARDAEEEGEVPACVRLLAEWVRRSTVDEAWRCRLRAIGEIVNTDEALRALSVSRRVGGKEPIQAIEPILVCNDGTEASVVRGEGFLEIDFKNAHSFSSVNQKGLQLTLDEWSTVAFRVGFFIESKNEEEQPERMLGCANLKGLDVSALKELSFPPNDNLLAVGNPTASDRGRGEMSAAPPIDPMSTHHGGASSDSPASSNGSEEFVNASPEMALGTSISPADVEGGTFFPPDADVSSPAEAADTGIVRDISPREALAATAAADVLARVSEPLSPSSSSSPSRLPLVHRPQQRVLLRCGQSTRDDDDRMSDSPSGAGEREVVSSANPHEVLLGGEPGAPQKETVTLTAVAAAAFAGGWFCAFLAMIIMASWSDLSQEGSGMEAGSSPLGVLGVWLLRLIRGA